MNNSVPSFLEHVAAHIRISFLKIKMSKKRILIVDDESDYCMIMKSYFRDKNYDVHLAYNLSDGLQLLDSLQPDILFLDNNLPDGKGWSHVENIVEKNPHIRLYLVSAYHQKGDFLSTSPNVIVWEKPLSLNLLNSNF
jgi:two-component system, OmpR family, response regulator